MNDCVQNNAASQGASETIIFGIRLWWWLHVLESKCFLPEDGEKVNFLLRVHSNTIQQGEFEIEKTVFHITNTQYLWDLGKLL